MMADQEIRSKQECRCDPTSFAGENVVGSASSAQVHDFEPDSGFHQGAQERSRGKALLLPGTKQNNAGVKLGKPFEILCLQPAKAGRAPILHDGVGQHDDAVLVTYGFVQFDETVPIPCEQVFRLTIVEMEFQNGYIPLIAREFEVG